MEEWADAEPLLKGGDVHGVEADVPECSECERLFHQARAALLSGDRSRLTDVRVYQYRHRADAQH